MNQCIRYLNLVFMYIFSGMDVVKAVEKVGSQSGTPSQKVRIVASGEIE